MAALAAGVSNLGASLCVSTTHTDTEPPLPPCLPHQELKRRIFPAEVVAALDAENAARLEEIRDEWGQLLADCEARNARKLELLARNQVGALEGHRVMSHVGHSTPPLQETYQQTKHKAPLTCCTTAHLSAACAGCD